MHLILPLLDGGTKLLMISVSSMLFNMGLVPPPPLLRMNGKL